ncbi:FAD-binding oxidoreductase [Pyxidicoccus fallax]|uniref:D-amino-acid oxidase n=1 Tax=Pyxidicoccus fallax TaxID=394095 RepID=A0A848LX10_9BACT|nr:FAD-dependent oxidoreductase [Pyxidicoccus fallax]NMO22169.1 FAD-dependent oxidoreductase [Pyxidicoccus fallax]NPC83790.1 FAD-binding oxidoreductase [Pyxidicoccus fallax]
MFILVLGGGVSGLSCGIRLAEAGHSVELWAREVSPHTTSDVAAAVWYPYRAGPQERVNAWAKRTYGVLQALGQEHPEAGILRVSGVEAFSAPVEDPWWRDSVPDFRRARPEELPPGFVDGYAFSAPVIEMPRYLPFLMARFQALGGRVVQREVRSLEEAWARAPVVVNCTGLGARALVGDESLYPIRGEVLRVEPPPVDRFIFADEADRIAYVIPRSRDCILGGTAEEGNASLEPDPREVDGILARTAGLLPPGTRVHVVEHKVGLRPGRPVVRVEAERVGGRTVVHDYGHGGAGVTLSWGCAEEVVALVEAHGR